MYRKEANAPPRNKVSTARTSQGAVPPIAVAVQRIRWLNRNLRLWKTEWALSKKDGKQKLPSTNAASECGRIGTRSDSGI